MLFSMVFTAGAAFEPKNNAFSVVEYDVATGTETRKTYEGIDAKKFEAATEALKAIEDGNVAAPMADSVLDNGYTKVNDTTKYPYSAIAFITVDFPGILSDGVATAWMISDNVAVTAAHCIYDLDLKSFAHGINLYAGKHGFGTNNDPFGLAYAEGFAVATQYKENGDKDYDWGVIRLNKSIGKETGTIKFAALSDGDLLGSDVTICGYPQSDDVTGIHVYNYNQYEGKGRISGFSPYAIYPSIPSTGGLSGSPILIGDNIACGLVSTGNTAMRVTDSMVYYFNEYISSHPAN